MYHPFVLIFRTYNELWKLTQEELGNILELETLDETIALEQERLTAMQKTSNLYLGYIQISNRLSDCHKNILQPQKRRLLQKLVDNCIGRALELKHELVGLEFSEVHYLDDLLLEMKLVPSSSHGHELVTKDVLITLGDELSHLPSSSLDYGSKFLDTSPMTLKLFCSG
ncbi:IQ and AAA domain-containing protein 1 [Trichonephila clavipes]|uniref:IQ and AAA domain-containing protein 1 n=1 Tax=Trichonephila clavipes TaxID=2585209 RepID=A0A8X6WIL9_TRICX|nr:IQ and AAA domain-containing protein 1 [Trichonephila clavipes]